MRRFVEKVFDIPGKGPTPVLVDDWIPDPPARVAQAPSAGGRCLQGNFGNTEGLRRPHVIRRYRDEETRFAHHATA